jgi:hypothetical protein
VSLDHNDGDTYHPVSIGYTTPPLPAHDLDFTKMAKKEPILIDNLMAVSRIAMAALQKYTQERLISIWALKKPAWQTPERKRIGTF